MDKMRVILCGILLLCSFVVVVLGTNESDQSPNPNKVNLKLARLLERLDAQEKEIGELKGSHDELKSKVKSLEEEMGQLKQSNSQHDGVWFLTPRLRGPPGKPGKHGVDGLPGPAGLVGQKGESGREGLRGPDGRQGPPGVNGLVGPTGPKGDRGSTGQTGGQGSKGQKGDQGSTGPKGDRGFSAPQSISSCSVAKDAFPSPRSAKQWIYPEGDDRKVQVLCDFENDNGGWTIIQKRSSGPQDEFYRSWSEYATGFGSLDGNFWLGLDNIRALTKNGDQELRIDMEDFNGNKRYAKYSSFSISDASDFYRLSISGYSGNVIESMTNHHNGAKFTTKDKDNDSNTKHNCAVSFPGGWWFNACLLANLNGLYRQKGETVPSGKGIHWGSWTGPDFTSSLAKTVMQIRTKT